MLHSEWERCRAFLEPSLKGDWDRFQAEAIALGADLWPAERSAMVCGVVRHPGRLEYHGYLAGGNLKELRAMEPSITAYARALGCDRIVIHGRRGWLRVFTDYRPAGLIERIL